MADTTNFASLVPGFEFLQGMVKNAGAALPHMGQWIAPTLNPEEIEKRIGELRTVQFWLEQNARMLGATIQALEVQRMTLSTLKTMNVRMADLRDAMKVPSPAISSPAACPPSSPAAPSQAPASADSAAAAGIIDPVRWWSALTQQFGELAVAALREPSASPPAAATSDAPSEDEEIAAGDGAPAVSASSPSSSDRKPTARKTAAAGRQRSGR